MRWLLALVLTVLFAACGGGGDDEPDVGATQTRSAEQTEVAIARSDNEPTETLDVSDTAVAEDTPTVEAMTEPTRTPTTEPTSTPRPTATVVPPTPTTPAPALGDKVAFADGTTVQVFQVARPIEVSEFVPVDPGNHYMALEVEYCAAPNIPSNETVSVFSNDFEIVMQDNTRATSSPFAVMDPAYQHAELAAGECLRGWIPYQVPEGALLQRVAYTGYTYDFDELIARWQLS